MKGFPLGVQAETNFSEVYREVIEALEEGVAVFDTCGDLITVNPAAERLLGLSSARLNRRELTDPRWQVVDENGSPLEFGRYPSYLSLQSGRPEAAVMGVYGQSGTLCWLRVNAQPVRRGGEIAYIVASFVDITEQRETQQRLEREALFRTTLGQVVTESLCQGLDERFYQRLLECAVLAIPGAQAGSLLLLEEARYKFVAAVGYDLSALQQTYLLPEELYRGDDAYKLLLVYGFDNQNIAEERRNIIDEIGRANAIEVCMSIPVILNGQPVAYFSLDNFETKDAFRGEAVEMGRIFAQQTAALWQRFKLEAETKRLAFYDALTDLPNRRLFYDRLGQALAQHRREGKPLAVMFVDLDDFKSINDTLGHDAGDVLLQHVARRFASVVRQGDTLARWGGDEFVLCVQLEQLEDVAEVAVKLLATLEHPFRIGGHTVQAQGSIGVDLLYKQPKNIEELVKHADIALYQAKASGKNTYQLFTAEMQRHLQVRLALEHDLREAVQHKTFTLDYQPRFDLQTRTVTSVEALIRWRHPERGAVAPGDFISLAEETGLILPIGEQVLAMAIRQAKSWQEVGSTWHVAVNVSAKQLAHPNFVESVQNGLGRYALDPHRLEIEITESAVMQDVDAAITKLDALRKIGVRVALDDFGTAYSSLTQLRRLPLDILKIDQAFVRDLTGAALDEVRGTEIVQTVIALGRSLGLTVVAEGVETQAQLELLQTLGCHEVQGYYLAFPQPAVKLEFCDQRVKVEG